LGQEGCAFTAITGVHIRAQAGRSLGFYPYYERREEGSSEYSGCFPHKHGDPQALAVSLTGQELAPALRQMSTLAIILRALMRRFTGA
jgi:hypothetical protein